MKKMSDVQKSNRGRTKTLTDSTRKRHKKENLAKYNKTFFSSTNNFAHAQTLSRMSSLSGRMNIARVNIRFFTGFKKIKQGHISFVLGYLRMIL
jgi:hypothetical protein